MRAVSHAASVLVNENTKSNFIALQSAVLSKGETTVVVVGEHESLLDSALSKNLLYSGYHNLIGTEGVSAFWNGSISNTLISSSNIINPITNVNGKFISNLNPNNMTFKATHLAFINNTNEIINEENAINRLIKLTDEKKIDVIKSIVTGTKLHSIKTATEALAFLPK